jgi:FdhD protein
MGRNMPDPLETIKILKVMNASGKVLADEVAREAPLTLFVNDIELVTLLCSPIDCKDLAVGFLYSEGVISAFEDIYRLSINDAKGIVWVTLKDGVAFSKTDFHRGRAVTSGCARGQTFAHLMEKLDIPPINTHTTFTADQILEMVHRLQSAGGDSSLFMRTGCVHVAVLVDAGRVVAYREDIGRHNAVDKVVGHCVIHGIDCSDKAIMVTGRLSSEMVTKAARLGIPLVISRTAPTSSALRIADEAGMTLVGFARGQRMNIYSHSHRVLLDGITTEQKTG